MERENDEGAALWNATDLRPLPAHVTPAIRGIRLVEKPADKQISTGEEKDNR